MTRSVTLIFFNMLVASTRASQQAAIPICLICHALERFIPDVGGSYSYSFGSSECDAQHCQLSNKFRLLHNNTNAALTSEAQGLLMRIGAGGEVLLDTSNDENMAHLLVLAFLGRQIVSTLQDTTPVDRVPVLFRYNVVSQMLEVLHPACVYEKVFYMTLLVASVVVIITALALRAIKVAPPPFTTPKPSMAITPTAGTSNSAPSKAAGSHTIRFGAAQATNTYAPDCRYRLLLSTD